MGIQKMSLANIKGKLSRAEMKNIMAGSGDEGCNGVIVCNPDGPTGCAAAGPTCSCKKQGSGYYCL